MAKSKNNGVDPQTMVDKYGADTVRLFSMFAAPPEQSLDWNEAGVEGMARFLRRLWAQAHKHTGEGPTPKLDVASLSPAARTLRRQLHETIQKVGDDYGRRHTFNTAIAAVMELLNAVGRHDATSASSRAVIDEALKIAVVVLSPVVPHVAESLWTALGGTGLVVDQRWPVADPEALRQDSVELVVQVNGKLRGRVSVAADADEAAVREAALNDADVRRHIGTMTIKKVIVVKGKLVSVVAA
jgi:leucyl-tRNA synthetase